MLYFFYPSLAFPSASKKKKQNKNKKKKKRPLHRRLLAETGEIERFADTQWILKGSWWGWEQKADLCCPCINAVR
jgi:hypothetical protein